MDKVVNEGSQWNKWVKDMKQIMVVKRRGQNEHLGQGERIKTNLYTIITKLTLIHKNITNSTNKIIVCVYVWARVCVCDTTKLQKELQI